MSHPIIMDLLGHVISAEEAEMLQHNAVSGVLLFSRNVADRQQLCLLTQAIHALRPDVIIMIDHEGGNVQRIQRHGFRSLMSARSHGDVYNRDPIVGLDMAREYGEIMAQDLQACGIDVSLAPVLDLHDATSRIIGQLDRAFHADPDVITKLATAYIEGMHAAGMPSVGKHFPGHGSCGADSHRELPVNHKTSEDLRASDLKPFIQLIKHQTLDGVMPAHVLYPSIDSAHATGYSRHWLQDILRDELHFDGLIISDCLGMTGADIGDLKTRAHRALHSGCDVLIVANQTRAALKQLINDIADNLNPQSAARIERFKQGIKRFQTQTTQPRSGYGSNFLNSTAYSTEETLFNPQNPTQSI